MNRNVPKRKTHEQFIYEISQVNPQIKILGRYVNTHTKIKCKCNVDNYEWEATPHNLLQKMGCPLCGGTKKKTHDEFCKELYAINNNILLTSRYINSQHKVKCKCRIDGHIWDAFPENLLKGHGCPECSRKRVSYINTKTHDNFIADVKRLSPTISILSKYNGSSSKVKCKCNICNNEWSTVATNLINGKGCPSCGLKRRISAITKSHEEFVSQMRKINPDIAIIGDYVNTSVPIKCRCKIDNNIWDATPANLLRGTACPACQNSHGEKAVSDVLNDLGIKYVTQYRFVDCKKIRTLPFDFYLPDFSTCIEYDGQQHYRPVTFGGCTIEQAIDAHARTKENDHIKNQYCQNNNINLIRIKYSDINNIRNIIEKEISFS